MRRGDHLLEPGSHYVHLSGRHENGETEAPVVVGRHLVVQPENFGAGPEPPGRNEESGPPFQKDGTDDLKIVGAD
ncbi:MAG TPA: hypothetical protein VGM94_03440 [Galbitalea sp.]|jgi:hypothetical protein